MSVEHRSAQTDSSPTDSSPTDPAAGVTTLIAHEWLEQILETRLDADLADPRCSWPTAVACLAVLGVAPPDPEPAAVIAHGLELAQRWPWSALRREASKAEGRWEVTPTEAAAMDDAEFADEMLATQVPLHDVYSDLAELLAPSVFRHITRTLDAWGVDPFYDRPASSPSSSSSRSRAAGSRVRQS
ncbi:MAG: hypothetical protein HKN26_15715 [Acidimicrobiales bacterium]|nr:hypothetical protein [Acidimicrobiales bacterium]